MERLLTHATVLTMNPNRDVKAAASRLADQAGTDLLK